jgi:hypothetical protein
MALSSRVSRKCNYLEVSAGSFLAILGVLTIVAGVTLLDERHDIQRTPSAARRCLKEELPRRAANRY